MKDLTTDPPYTDLSAMEHAASMMIAYDHLIWVDVPKEVTEYLMGFRDPLTILADNMDKAYAFGHPREEIDYVYWRMLDKREDIEPEEPMQQKM